MCSMLIYFGRKLHRAKKKKKKIADVKMNFLLNQHQP